MRARVLARGPRADDEADAARARGDTDAGGEGFTAASRALGESCFSESIGGGFGCNNASIDLDFYHRP